jgi:hypothetical protein
MKLINPILITLNNTLYIKADNLEPVEVDSSCAFDLKIYVHKKYFRNLKKGEYAGVSNELEKGINISELSDRIFISRKWKPLTDFCNDCGSGTHKNQCDNADSGCIHFTSKAFLLPVKECKCFRLGEGSKWQTYLCDIHNEIVDKKSYSIEEIEKAIDDLGFIYDNVKEAIINNLKK